ncbi:2-C-methyl-D-erythritol 2,4-cyclodiphosphate synthase [hydrothermal vent metagenome]|uniref:2-C-methyl-D-erythritol 2,4-cyclodiphosphate synthase n=1 Tax=hydrothermal vent metagenome TaxID=652676 RepID=A0A3B0YX00_9ZZZZ
MRIGHGYDVHQFQLGGQLVLGGVTIEFDRSMKAHSDGDVIIHAICDALLGATGLGDIGRHFPDTDPQFKNINSRQLLRQVNSLVQQQALSVSNLDVTVIAQVPKLSPYIEQMCLLLADDLGIQSSQINIKATTTEQLGYIGREEGISVHAVCLLQ